MTLDSRVTVASVNINELLQQFINNKNEKSSTRF